MRSFKTGSWNSNTRHRHPVHLTSQAQVFSCLTLCPKARAVEGWGEGLERRTQTTFFKFIYSYIGLDRLIKRVYRMEIQSVMLVISTRIFLWTVAPLTFSLVQLYLLPSLCQRTYKQTVCGWEGVGGVEGTWTNPRKTNPRKSIPRMDQS